MTNNIAVAHVNDTSPTGMNLWTVGGISELSEQSFWFRIGSSGGQTAVYSLPQLNISQSAINTLTTENANSKIDVTINYALSGGTAGSGTSQLQETITINNLTSGSLDLHFYQYVDLNLGGGGSGDSLQLGKTGSLFTTATQTGSGVLGGETLLTGANHGEAGLNTSLSNKIEGSSPASLADNTGVVGPGNEAFGLEWDNSSLASHGTMTIQVEKTIASAAPVPEPSAAVLLSLALAGLLGRSLSRR